MTNDYVHIAILGGGVAGLGAAFRAAELGAEATIFEARQSAGGLLDNFTIDGFRFDHAVHLSFATEKVVRSIFDRTPFNTHPSDSYCFETDRWLKHPVQNNLFPLSTNDRIELIKSFLERPSELLGDSYDSWLRHQYGDSIAERYPIRYTKKYWCTPASQLSTSWIGNRMRRAELDEILFGALSPETPNHYYTKEMRYPRVGGFKAFIQPLINSADIRCGHRCVNLDLMNKKISFDNGNVVRYEFLISSLPLPELVSMANDIPEEVVNAARMLKATSIDLISVGFNRKIVKDLWFYIYDDDILASRAHSPSVKSPENAPLGCSSLQFEIYSRGPESMFDPENLKQNSLYALKKMGISSGEDIIVLDHRHVRYGNVIFDQGMEKRRDLVRNYLNSQGIKTIGRFGEWDYLWSNNSFMSGYGAL
jgi:protoporphyrinogen oxidase